DLERVLEPLHLGQPPVDRGLTTLERRRDLLAGVGALGPATGGLPLGALAAAHPGPGALAPRRRPQVMHLDHSSTSSTRTRWLTVKIIPRTSGRSSLITTSLMRLRPSVRSVARWLGLRPIPERTWVTFSRAIVTPPPRQSSLPTHRLRCRRRPARRAWPPAPPPPPADRAGPRPPPAAPASSAPSPWRARC